jgi:hypothetical protein
MSPISSTSASASASASAALANAASNGVSAISNGSRQLDQDAQRIANPNGSDVTSALVETTQSLQLAQAGADVISTSNEMLGTLLNVFA